MRLGRPARSRHWRSDEILIDLSAYQRLVRVDRDNGWATVEAGISLRRLGIALGSWGLSLENGSRRPAQALGAAVSLGAHGSAAAHGSLATEVTGLRLVIPDGTVVDCSATEEPEIFAAARVGLGAVGLISTVTLRCRPGFNVRSTAVTLARDEALARFEADVAANDFYELAWWPGPGRRARVVTANRTTDPADGDAVDRSYRWWHRRRPGPPALEYSFGRDEAGPALQRASELTDGTRHPALFPIEVSVSAGDDIPLSPASGRASLHIAGLAGLDGRPAWGAPHGLGAAALKALYPRWDEWQAVRDRLDPDRRLVQISGQG